MLKGRKLLLADDSVTIQKVVDLTFTDEGMKVTTVGTGDLVIEKLEAGAPDIVLADVFMPGLSGYKVCERIKGDERFRHIPVMLLVGAFEPFDEAEARRVGADGFLTKPFQSIRGLVNKVGSLLTNRTGEEETAERIEEPRRADTPLPPFESTGRGTSTESLITHDPEPPIKEAFADEAMDDQMIEATPATEFGSPSGSRSTTPLVAAETTKDQRTNLSREGEELPSLDLLEDSLFTPESDDHLVQPPYATHVANAATADDALLDLGDIEPPHATAEADDFILDLADETPTPQTQFAETADKAAAVYEPAPLTFAASVAPIASPTATTQVSTIAATAQRDLTAAPREDERAGDVRDSEGQRIDLDQLPPEVIDQIARRVMEHLSEKVVREIAWEVVPQLAELLIKRRLEEERSKSQ